MTAIRAMLGDPDAYAESPDFTLRRLQLRLGKGSDALDAALHRRFDSSPYSSRPGSQPGVAYDWGGRARFLTESVNNIDAVAEAIQLEATSPAAAGMGKPRNSFPPPVPAIAARQLNRASRKAPQRR